MIAPTGYKEVVHVFGDPLKEGWGPSNLALVRFPEPLRLSWDLSKSVSRCMVHRILKSTFEDVFDEIWNRNLWAKLGTYGGTYVHRFQRGSTDRLSTHAFGIAIDIDVLNNGLGESPTLDERVVEIFEGHGFIWGGRWKRPDGMHFQFADGY